MKILIDMQGVQTESRHRGIGRYCLAVTRAILEMDTLGHDIHLLFNAALDGADEAIETLAEAGLGAHRRAVGPIRNTSSDNGMNDARRDAAERVFTFALDAAKADVVWFGSLVEGFANDALAPHARPEAFTVATLYDLIPLHEPEKLGQSRARDWYMRRINTLKRCDLLLAISEWARTDAIERLGIDPQRIVAIGAGVDRRFTPPLPGTDHRGVLAERFGISRPFLMYNGGFEERKNVLALVDAYASLQAPLRRRHVLVVVGRVDTLMAERFAAAIASGRLHPDEVIFTGYVDDTDLVRLYQACAVFVFPSESEGFGLPPLEAMACGAPTLVNDATSLPEVVGNAEALFDAHQPGSMAARMEAVLTDADLARRLRHSGIERASRFTWSSVAARAVAAIESRASRRKRSIVPDTDARPSLPVYRMDAGNVTTTLPTLRRWPGTVVWSGPLPPAGPTQADDRFRLGGYAHLDKTGDGADWLSLLEEEAVGVVRDDGLTADVLRECVQAAQRSHPLGRQLAVEQSIAANFASSLADDDLARVADALVRAQSGTHARWLVDVTHIASSDVGTGVHRVVRSILREWLLDPPDGIRIEPVAFRGGRYHHAHAYACGLIGAAVPSALPGDIVAITGNESYIGLDWTMESLPSSAPLLRTWRRAGVAMHFIVHDLLPLTLPDAFHPKTRESFAHWMKEIAGLGDVLHCVSRTTASDVENWLKDNRSGRQPSVTRFGLGADIGRRLEGGTLPPALDQVLARIPSFLMVGTLEPRKGHAQALDAMELLWESGVDAALLIIGQRGWMVNDLVERIRKHRENDRRLFWLDNASDATLAGVYERSTALLAASRGEGYGLPLIEAAQHGKPVIARSLPVFKEVAGDYPSYFDADTPAGLATHIARWLVDRPRPGSHPAWRSWKQSAAFLGRAIADGQGAADGETD